MLGLLGDAIHVRHRRAAVDGGDVAAVELLDAAPEGLEQRRTVSTWTGRMITATPPPWARPASAAL
jgi:hypothetical protein